MAAEVVKCALVRYLLVELLINFQIKFLIKIQIEALIELFVEFLVEFPFNIECEFVNVGRKRARMWL